MSESVNFSSITVKHTMLLYWPREVKFLTRGHTALVKESGV